MVTYPLSIIAILLGTILLVPMICRKIRIPSIVGFIMVGIILSVVLVDHDTYLNSPTKGLFSYQQAYEYSRFHHLTHWGNWLHTNLQSPTDNPCGQQL